MSPHKPQWFVNGSVQESVRRATEVGEDVDRIAEQLDAFVFDGVSRDRIERVVQRVQSRSVDDVEVTLSQPPSTDETPRDWPDRYVDSSDVEYLSDREFARVLGLVLEGFEGSTVRPPANESVVPDLYWNRSHRTIAFRTVTRQHGTEVDESVLTELLEGDSKLAGKRSPSDIYVVTNTSFTEAAESAAEESDFPLVDRPRLEMWFQLARVDVRTAGIVLEEGETHDGSLSELFDDEQADLCCPRDPLTVSSTVDFAVAPSTRPKPGASSGGDSNPPDIPETSTPSTEKSADNGPLTADEQHDPGERGTLYADPGNDGDYEAFDAFLDDLDEET